MRPAISTRLPSHPKALEVRSRAIDALESIRDLHRVAGNHSRYLYDFSPDAVVLRWTHDPALRLMYCFEQDEHGAITADSLLSRISSRDIDGSEVVVGGPAVLGLRDSLTTAGSSLHSGHQGRIPGDRGETAARPGTLEMDSVVVKASVPVVSFRPYLSRDYQDTYPVPPPATVFGMLLSLCGIREEVRSSYCGTELAIMVDRLREPSPILRKLRRDSSSDQRRGTSRLPARLPGADPRASRVDWSAARGCGP